jgi:phosphoribosylglycinamide formyltransferase-1
MTKRIILFASGNGSNVENICNFFEQNPSVSIEGVFTNNPKAGVIERAKQFNVEVHVFNKKDFTEGYLLEKVVKIKPKLIILAGFLWRIGEDWVKAFPKQIINIHPALLPKYGGKGMYGEHVHHAVKANKESETGITIHYVNENYDEGAIVFQKKVVLTENNSVAQIAAKVHELEYRYFPEIIAQLLEEVPNEV